MEVNVHEAKTHLSRLLERVANGKEVAETMPKRRELGWARGEFTVPEDFYGPLPDESVSGFYR
jgi:hypothetical protein